MICRIMIILNRNSHKKLIILAVYALIINFYITKINADDYKPNDYYASIEKSNQADWMSQLPDDVFLNDLSIPGTHDSMAVWGNIGKQPPTPPGLTDDITKVQQRFNEDGPDSLAKQLEAGIRSIDIRVVFTKSKNKDDPIPSPQLAIHHGIIYEHANFLDVLRVTYNFLNQHSKETIVMRLKLEKGSGKDSADFSDVFKKYRDSDPYGQVLYAPSVSGDASISIPKLGDVRGKVVLMLLNGKNGGVYGGFGIHENLINIQDKFEFQGPNGSGKKFKHVTAQFEAVKDSSNQKKLMINFVSATTKFGVIPGTLENGPSGIAHDINQRVWTYLNNNYARESRTGILMFDYPGWKLIDKVISFNRKKRSTNKRPNLGKNVSTFKINSGGTSFDVSIPAESLATYVWEDGKEPEQWLTTAQNGGFGYKLDNFMITSEGSATTTINIDINKQYQTIDGFGAALTDSAANLIAKSSKRDEIMQKLFGTGDGEAGLTFVRVPMGSSDLMYDANNIYTYEDNQGTFSIDKDATTIDLLRQAKSISGNDLKILGTPWSAPGWMKRGKSILPKDCGSDVNQLDSKYYGEYASYFKKYVDAYTAAGVRPWMVSMQNEPQNCKTQMPTTQITSEDAIQLSKQLKSQLPGDVKVLGWDHNWNDQGYVNALVNNGAVDAIGYHCYDGTNYKDQTQSVATYMTECSGFTDQSSNVPGNMGWEVANTIIGPLRYNSKGSIYWSLAQRKDGSPSLGGSDACKTCRGMITISDDGNNFEPSQDFYFWAHFSRFVRPGAIRVDSQQSGTLSTAAFRQGNKNILVVLNSSTNKADGGSSGSDGRDLRGYIVQWDGDNSAQKTAWLVGSDGYRRWISDGSTFNCLKYDAGMKGPEVVSAGSLDRYLDIKDCWAVCGAGTMGTRSQLEIGTYLKSNNGASLTLTTNGLLAVDSRGNTRWAPPGKGNRLILQEDQNLVLYNGNQAVWASNTKDSGAIWLSIYDDGSYALFNKDNKKIWSSEINPDEYRGKIVQWDGDNAQQKTSWLVGADGYRRWIHDWETYKCLKDVGWEDSFSVSSGVLDKFPDLNNVWATCGADRIGPNSALEKRSYLRAGEYSLTLTNDDLVLAKKGEKIWSTGKEGAQLILQPDGNLVEYDSNRTPVWATATDGKKPGWLVLGDDGSLRLYDGDNNQVWSAGANVDPEKYRGKIVQWDGDNAQQKTSWLVGADGYRRWIHDWGTYKCLRDAGWEDSFSVSSGVLDKFPDLNNVWATCGADRIGPNSALERRSYLRAGEYSLTLTNDDLVLAKKSEKIWSTGKGGAQLILQPDGNLVEYDSNRTPVWATVTDGKKPGWLVLGDDGSLRLYDADGKQIWSR